MGSPLVRKTEQRGEGAREREGERRQKNTSMLSRSMKTRLAKQNEISSSLFAALGKRVLVLFSPSPRSPSLSFPSL